MTGTDPMDGHAEMNLAALEKRSGRAERAHAQRQLFLSAAKGRPVRRRSTAVGESPPFHSRAPSPGRYVPQLRPISSGVWWWGAKPR